MEKFLDTILNWFTSRTIRLLPTRKLSKERLNDLQYTPGSAFAVCAGKYLGEFFVYMEQTESTVYFLSLPKMEPRQVPIDKFKYGVDNKVLEFQEILPKKIREVCIEQYKKNAKKSNN